MSQKILIGNIRGPQGETGAQGPTGAAGPRGPAGVGAAVVADTLSLTEVWSNPDTNVYAQEVTVSGATEVSRIDLQPSAAQLVSLFADGVQAMYIENDAGTLTAYAIGAAPSTAMTLQCTVTEVIV